MLFAQVEHVRRLNERGNKILLAQEAGMLGADLNEAERLFSWGLRLNANCSASGRENG